MSERARARALPALAAPPTAARTLRRPPRPPSVPLAASPSSRRCSTRYRRARTAGLVSQIVVFCRDRRGMLLDVSTAAVTDEAENIIDVHSETLDASGRRGRLQYSVHVRDAARARAQRAVRKVDSVVHVARGNMAEMRRTRGKTAFWSLCRRSEFSRRGGGGAWRRQPRVHSAV